MTFVGDLPRGLRRALGVCWAALAVGLLIYVTHLLAGLGSGPVARPLLDDWLYEALIVGAAVAVLARVVLVREERLAWAFIAGAVLAWAAGDVYWWRVLSHDEAAPYPSISDGLYLLFYPLAYVGMVLLLRARVRRFHASQWLDGLAAGLMVAALGGALVVPRIVAANEGAATSAVTTNLAYPLGDLLIAGLAVGLGALMSWRAGRSVGLLAAGFLIFSVADSVYLARVAGDGYVAGGILDAGWPAGMLCIALAAWLPSPPGAVGRLEGWRVTLIPAGVALGALALFLYDHHSSVATYAVWLAAAALVVCMARAGLTFRENVTQAVTDALTSLPNRTLFNDRVEQAVRRARRSGGRLAVMIVDLDRFKEVNDTLGHHSGDLLLKEIARRIRGALRESDTVARLGGDEFGVLLPAVADAAAAEWVATMLGEIISVPIIVDGLSLDTEASIGIALFPDHGQDPPELLQRADVAMYTAKAESRPFAHYGPELDEHSPERLTLIGELRRAIEQDELVLHYQPKVNLADGGLAGLEALVRWEHPVRGLLFPGEFIPLAEHTALIRPLTMHVIDRALAQSAQWDGAFGGLRVSVNISARNLLDVEFADAVTAALGRRGIAPGRLELEITETALMANPNRALEVLHRLHDAGVVLSIDDFGVGYSSLNYLKKLPIDVLKIDRSFVMNMTHDPADEMIVRSTIDLGRNLGLQVIAEGIENTAAYESLRALGCSIGQGFHIGRPLPAEELVAWLAAARDDGTLPRSAAASPG